jgi:hypothetical protein
MRIEDLLVLPKGEELDCLMNYFSGDKWVKARFVCMSDVRKTRTDPQVPAAIVEIEPFDFKDAGHWDVEYVKPESVRLRHERVTFYGRDWLDDQYDLHFYGWHPEPFDDAETVEILKKKGFREWFGNAKEITVERPLKR